MAPSEDAPAQAPAPIDWLARWRALAGGREAQARRVGWDPTSAGPGWWDQRALHYHEVMRGSTAPDPFLAQVAAAVDADTTVLDVGAGTGIYTLALARQARRVVAVEPAASMLRLLKQEVAASGLGNVAVVEGSWPQVEVAPADVVVCANVVTPIVEIGPFLEKLLARTRRVACLLVALTPPDDHLRELWLELHGEERIPPPGFIETYNVLYQLGRYADARIIPVWRPWWYRSLDEAIQDFAVFSHVAPDGPARDSLRAHAERTLEQRDGRWYVKTSAPRYTGMITVRSQDSGVRIQ